MKKKLLATLLLLAMAICLLPAAAFADSAEPSNASGARTIKYAFKDCNGQFYLVDSSVLVTTGSSYKGYVIVIQEVLNELSDAGEGKSFHTGYLPDGIFGSGTLRAVKNFQSYYGLDIDGVVGPSSWGKLYDRWYNTLEGHSLIYLDSSVH